MRIVDNWVVATAFAVEGRGLLLSFWLSSLLLLRYVLVSKTFFVRTTYFPKFDSGVLAFSTKSILRFKLFVEQTKSFQNLTAL